LYTSVVNRIIGSVTGRTSRRVFVAGRLGCSRRQSCLAAWTDVRRLASPVPPGREPTLSVAARVHAGTALPSVVGLVGMTVQASSARDATYPNAACGCNKKRIRRLWRREYVKIVKHCFKYGFLFSVSVERRTQDNRSGRRLNRPDSQYGEETVNDPKQITPGSSRNIGTRSMSLETAWL
jgi:hypothetical protein